MRVLDLLSSGSKPKGHDTHTSIPTSAKKINAYFQCTFTLPCENNFFSFPHQSTFVS